MDTAVRSAIGSYIVYFQWLVSHANLVPQLIQQATVFAEAVDLKTKIMAVSAALNLISGSLTDFPTQEGGFNARKSTDEEVTAVVAGLSASMGFAAGNETNKAINWAGLIDFITKLIPLILQFIPKKTA